MTQTEIEILFKQVVSDKGFSKASGYSKQLVYNYRHRKTSLGQQLEVLFNFGAIDAIELPLKEDQNLT